MRLGPELVDRVLAGDHQGVARAITYAERGDRRLPDFLAKLYPSAGQALVLGVTGPPGAGKSTMVSSLASALVRMRKKVAILAVDPSSSLSGGALLGDRIRMIDLAEAGVYIRSMATRGAVGGLARATMDAVTIADAAGFDVVIVETVGVGQAEVDVLALAHTVLVVSVPGLGDGVQALKAGLLEIADIHVVNKADREGADRTAKEILENLRLRKREAHQWNIPVKMTVATTGQGIPELLDSIDQHREWMRETDELQRRTRANARERLLWAATDLATQRVETASNLDELLDQLVQHDLDPLTVAARLLDATDEPTREDEPDDQQ